MRNWKKWLRVLRWKVDRRLWGTGRLRRLRERARRAVLADAGFTLIELLVVLAIIGILTALLVPRLLAAMESSQLNNLLTDARELQAGMQLYYEAHGYYPGESGTALITSYSQLWSYLHKYVDLPNNQSAAGFNLAAAPVAKWSDGNSWYLQTCTTASNKTPPLTCTWTTNNPGSYVAYSVNQTPSSTASYSYELIIQGNDPQHTQVVITDQGIDYDNAQINQNVSNGTGTGTYLSGSTISGD